MINSAKKHSTLIFVLAALLLILSPVFFCAEKADASSIGVINIEIGVNVRSGPGTGYDIIGAVAYGSSVTIIGESGSWYRINYNGGNGYISSDYVTVREEEDFTQTTATVNSAIGLNVRSGPGTQYSTIFTLDNYAVVTVTGKEGDWYKISYNGRSGYVSAQYLVLDENEDYVYDQDFESALSAQGFPESYKYYLRQLHAAHPQWVFKAHSTGLSWTDVINKETANVSTNLVHKSQPDSWKSTEPGAVDSDGNYVEFDSGGYVAASRGIVEYYMDPRNFLNEGGIFQFMAHSYDPQTQTKSGLQKLVAGTFLSNKFPEAGYDTYSDALIYAAKQSGANPYVLASMILVEQGRDGRGNSISGKVSGYVGYYNFFNVGAYASGGRDAVENGLIYAKNKGWNSRIKSIVGGAVNYAQSYIKNNQNTLYLKKFNVMNGLGEVATHQYMTNVSGASQEAANLRQGYDLDSAITFYIPVYKNMPSAAVPAPGSGNNNCFLKSLSVSGYSLTPSFGMYEFDYELVVPSDTSYITVSAKAGDSGAKVSGTGKVQLTGNVTEVKVVVTATSGVKKTYTITVARETSSGGASLTSSEYKIGSTITGVDLKTSVSSFKSKIKVPSGYTMKVLNSSGKEVTSGNIGTGMRAVLYKNGSAQKSHTVVIKGDVNGDGACSSVDALMAERYIIGTYNLTGAFFSGSDINGDGKVSTVDVLYMERHIIGTYEIKN